MKKEILDFEKSQVQKVIENRKIEGKLDFVDFKNHFRPGDTISVFIKNFQANKTFKTQEFRGICIAKKARESKFIVRKISTNGIAIEKELCYYSNTIDKISVTPAKKNPIRAKLYYLRERNIG